MDVFKQLLEMDVEQLPVWKVKEAGDWVAVLNIMRQLRPTRSSSQTLGSINQIFDETKFHFNKSFLKPEILWEGGFGDVQLRVLFNKFPFSDYHLIIVVSPEKNSSQLITKDAHQCLFSLVEDMSVRFPGFGVGFNSIAAGASVNHLHFQGFIRESMLAIENSQWRHNGGDIAYPLAVTRFADVDSSWQFINRLVEEDKAFNCLYRNNYCYVIPRKYQGTFDVPEWLTGAGWIDVAGVITVSEDKILSSIDESAITQALKNLVVV
jgi:ATP adenylyltransferase/5',5'''-P-1,P-4-tetraphosphate phosphorylase II